MKEVQTIIYFIDGSEEVVDHPIGHVKNTLNGAFLKKGSQPNSFVSFTKTELIEEPNNGSKYVEKTVVVNSRNITKFEEIKNTRTDD